MRPLSQARLSGCRRRGVERRIAVRGEGKKSNERNNVPSAATSNGMRRILRRHLSTSVHSTSVISGSDERMSRRAASTRVSSCVASIFLRNFRVVGVAGSVKHRNSSTSPPWCPQQMPSRYLSFLIGIYYPQSSTMISAVAMPCGLNLSTRYLSLHHLPHGTATLRRERCFRSCQQLDPAGPLVACSGPSAITARAHRRRPAQTTRAPWRRRPDGEAQHEARAIRA